MSPRIEPIAADPLTTYARDVVAGKVPAGKYHKLGCARHLRDMARAGTEEFPYRLDLARAERLFRFAENLKHYKGQWAGTPIRLEPWQKFILGSVIGWVHVETGLRRIRTAFNQVPRKNGKALAIDTLVATPTGWTRHGDIRPGDYVFGSDGAPVRVIEVSSHYEGPCYRVCFSGGQELVAHDRHEWITDRTWYTKRRKGPHNGPLPVVETHEIAKTLRGGARGDLVHRVKLPGALRLPKASLPIPPYTFGAWLGDGTSSSATITFADTEIADRIRAEGVPCAPRKSHGNGLASLYALSDGDRRQSARNAGIASRLRRLGVLNNKHIPTIYLRASYAQRLELLRGIVDTDGHCTKRGQYEVVSVHERLAADIVELIHTLGLKASCSVDRAQLRGVDMGPRYRVQFYQDGDAVAHLSRKQSSPHASEKKRRCRARTIMAVDRCAATIVNCLQVEGGTYLAGEQMIPTHNSLLAAVVLLYLTFFDGEAGAEGYAIATKRDQAKIVFGDAKQLVVSSGLRSRISVLVANLHRDETSSKLEPLGADHDSTDGLNPNVVVVDEMHAMKDRGMLDVMETATGARQQPVIYEITTFGDDPVSPWGDQNDYSNKILEGVLVDESFFVFTAHADPDDDWTLASTARKANPNYGISVNPEDLASKVLKAIGIPAAAATYKQKHLNLPGNASHPCLSVDGWRKGQTQGVTRAQFAESLRHQSCYAGIDLASKLDLCVLSLLFPPGEGRKKWALLQHIWTPEETISERAHRDRAPYEVWVSQGWMGTTPGPKINQQVVREALVAARGLYEIELVGYDQWHADKLIDEIIHDDGFGEEMVLAVPQTFAGMSSACLQIQADILAGEIDACGCPVTAWAVSNTVDQRDGKDNMQFVKKRSRGRIDPVVAATIARALFLRQPPAAHEPSYQMFFAGGR